MRIKIKHVKDTLEKASFIENLLESSTYDQSLFTLVMSVFFLFERSDNPDPNIGDFLLNFCELVNTAYEKGEALDREFSNANH